MMLSPRTTEEEEGREDLTNNQLDFSQPWHFSDVVLKVEEERFHVHRSILSMWSPTFSKMFTSGFREKTAEEVPLPGKIASQIREMLLAIYPTSAKEIDDENYSFLLDLAREYMIEKLTEKCEDFLIHKLRWPRQQHSSQCLDLLVTAQSYNLERLQEECIKNAGNLSRQELNSHSKRHEILLPNYRKLVDGIMERMENKLMELQRSSSGFALY